MLSITPPADPSRDLGQAPERLAGRNNLLHVVQLRWLAVAGQLATILFVHFVLRVPLPLREMLTVLAVLVLFNLGGRWRSTLPLPVRDSELFAGLLVDVVVLTGQLYLSGGITNPFIFLYLLQVAVATVLLRPRYVWAMVAITGLCFMVLTEWYRPVPEQGVTPASLPTEYVLGLLACFLLNAGLLVVFIGRFQRNLSQRDASLAKLRQRAAEEEHIVRMGLLASGAAHELGTPLATLSVIVGDWAHMAPFAAEPELREELEEMQRQIGRCKSIVSGILTSAGESRAEAPQEIRLREFLDDLFEEWRRTRGLETIEVRRDGVPDVPIIADKALRQMVDNVLDNALEAASGQAPKVAVHAEHGMLELRVRDHGSGFPAAMLERIGVPYRSSKGAPGRGLGLFLAVNVARTLGGELQAHNVPDGGAEVVISLPLSSLMPERFQPRGH